MTTIKTSHRSLASLKLPKQAVALAAFSTSVAKAMSGNPLFATPVTGLTPASTAQFRYRPVTKAGEGDWSQTVVLLVK
jgi:hypothetical protein